MNRIDLWGMSDDDPPTVSSILKNFGKGVWNSGKNTVVGLWNTVTHPINTVESIYYSVKHPVETGRAIVQTATETYDDFQSGDANVKAAIIGEGFGEAAQLFIGSGEVKIITNTKKLKRIGTTGKIGENALKKLGGQSQKSFKTSKGLRFVDQYANGVAHESKVGYTTFKKSN